MLRLATDPDESREEVLPKHLGDSPIVGVLGPRGTRAAVAAVVVLGLSLVVVSGLAGKVRAWVHERPEFSWTVDRIVLEPPPPSWLRAGEEGLLADVGGALREFDRGSALDLDLGSVERAFKNAFWVDRVRSVRRSYPDRIQVSVDYRQPVALVPIEADRADEAASAGNYLVLDGSGLILDRIPIGSDQGRAFRSELVILSGLRRPSSFRVGEAWPGSPDPEGSARPDPVAGAAAQLAKFLLDRARLDGWPENRAGQLLHFRRIHPFDGDARKLYLAQELPGGKILWVVWGAAPGEEGSLEPSADQKWEMLRNWIASGGADRDPDPGALGFTLRGPIWLPPAPLPVKADPIGKSAHLRVRLGGESLHAPLASVAGK